MTHYRTHLEYFAFGFIIKNEAHQTDDSASFVLPGARHLVQTITAQFIEKVLYVRS